MAVGAASTIAYWATAAAAAYSVYSTVQSGQQSKLNAEAQADQAENDASTAASAAKVQADRIRRMARIQAGQANAGLAASGVDTGEGSAININEDIVKNAEQDAALTVFGGANQADRLNADASNYSQSGDRALSNAYGQAGSTLISSGAQAYSGWKGSTAGANKQGQGNALTSNPAYVRNM